MTEDAKGQQQCGCLIDSYRFTSSLIRLTICDGVTRGFKNTSVAPNFLASSLSCGSAELERTIIGISLSLGVARNVLSASKPFKAGIIKSRRIISNGSVCATLMPQAPFSAT